MRIERQYFLFIFLCFKILRISSTFLLLRTLQTPLAPCPPSLENRFYFPSPAAGSYVQLSFLNAALWSKVHRQVQSRISVVSEWENQGNPSRLEAPSCGETLKPVDEPSKFRFWPPRPISSWPWTQSRIGAMSQAPPGSARHLLIWSSVSSGCVCRTCLAALFQSWRLESL